ncbi:hypothetical protein [Myroides phaeus]|uniref:5-bromo-4-chloroindolyl phosphate hydrolysis protein n=1 Tax=Myroides phaeus TaxID=702745 RepID=A0A1G8H472_9FLAO|nr:hypothetical protein [Myroides phaeus]MEC4117827.1 hypothetical protein [Myroides phaeus]SDI01447.1 hypothetical protein SAMN05421818_1413 [Myroides phaeus]
MGVFTEKSKNWEVKTGWLSILAIAFPFILPPGAMFYMAIVGRIRNLIYGGLVWSALYVSVYFMYLTFGELFLVKVISFLVMLSGAVVVGMHYKSFLQRVDLRSIINVRWGVEYDYVEFMRRKRISEVLSVSDFVISLDRWKNVLTNDEVKGNIALMISMTKSITKNNKNISNLFLERHAYSIENILQQYHQLELSKLDNDTVKQAELKLRSTIAQATKAFENELMNQMKFQNIEMESESEVYVQDLKNRGLL